jgi:hypothetical protein
MRSPVRSLVAKIALASATALGAVGAGAPAAHAASDPSLRWYTVVTPHFRVTYHSGLAEVAAHVASVAEGIHDTMAEHVGHVPRDITEILLTDFSESANGSATALPYNAVRLLVTAPEDMSPLGDVDDWYLELVTHEYTHILHTDNISGIPAVANAILGKTYAPNQVQPRWILEGLATYHESARTSGGRVRSSMWNMFMRADVLEDHVAGIDQISASVRRWPQGNLWYLYGSLFMDWIARTKGEQVLRAMANDYGRQVVPWGFNRAMRRASGETFVEMYPQWIAAMKAEYGAQAEAVRKRGLREGARITHHGATARYPRFVPRGAWPGHEGDLLYYREDQHERTGLYVLPITRDARGAVTRSGEANAELVARTPNESYATFGPDGSLVFSSLETYKNVFSYGDLEKLEPGKKSAFGTQDGGRVRLTQGLRAADPAVSPDGRRVVFTINRSGTRSIHLGALRGDEVLDVRALVPNADLEQAFTPRWSPDGRYVAYGLWKRGGYRDVRVVDVDAGTSRDVTVDRAVDGDPSWSPDGKHLFFHSDRTGIMNVYAWEVATARLFQVTDVVNGAYAPEVSPDGKTLVYVGYTTKGYDLFAMPLDPLRWTEAEPYVDARPPMPLVPERRFPVEPYSPLRTLAPRRWSAQITPGNFGQAVITSVAQSDIAGLHTVGLTSTVELERPFVQGSLAYTYGRLPFDVGVSAFRSIAPRGGFQIGPGYKPVVVQETTGFSSSIVYGKPTPYDTQQFIVTQSVARVGATYPFPAEKLDPYETPQIPARGMASTLRLAYAYSNAEKYLWGVSPERGFAFSVAFDLTDPALGSDFAGFAANGDFTTYVKMPWLSHHALALHAGTGTSGGQFPGRGAFYVGGYVDLPIIDTVRDQLFQGGVVLRGYEPVALAGRSYVLGNAEYRFPIVNLDRGSETLPFVLNRISGTAFVDYGSAFDAFRGAPFKTGAGGELWFETTMGYVATFLFRAGYARGLASGGIDKLYFVAAVPY